MDKGRLGAVLLPGLIGTVIVLYPVIVYFGIQSLSLGTILAVLAIALAARLVFGGGLRSAMGLATAVGLLFCLLVWLAENKQGLLYYPVVMNSALLLVFGYSLIKPPSVIEQLARLAEPNLPASGVAYTRKVTLVWMIFFLVNGGLALATIHSGSLEVWALYNGFIAYIAMGVLFTLEWLVRRKVRALQVGEK